jgi:hypothetical protein
MAKPRVKNVRQFVLLLVICACSAALGFVMRADKGAPMGAKQSASTPDPDEKVIAIYQYEKQPYEIKGLSVRGVRIKAGVKFSATSVAAISGGPVGDWIEDLEFTIKNVSDKVGTYVDVQLDFPDTLSNGPKMVFSQMGLGEPAWASKTRRKYVPMYLQPGQEITFRLSALDLRNIKSFLAFRDFTLTDMSEIEIRSVLVNFSDGTKWENGDFWKPSPDSRSGFERVDQQTARNGRAGRKKRNGSRMALCPAHHPEQTG